MLCATEFVASVPFCTDCGGSLRAGPLPDPPSESEKPRDGAEATVHRTHDPPDTLLLQRPGLEAEEVARILNLEGIPCLLECQGMQSLRLADREPAEPLAISLPVSVLVPAALLAEAKEILQSLQQEDAVGDQWAAPSEGARPEPPGEDEGARPSVDPDRMGPPSASPEGTSLRFLIVLAIGGLAIFWMIGK